MNPTDDGWYLRVRIKGIEFDISTLKSTNHGGRNNKSIEALEKALSGYRKQLEEIEQRKKENANGANED